MNQTSTVVTSKIRALAATSLSSLFLSEEFSDVRFEVEGRTFPANRRILASRSEYFRAMLLSGFRESRQETIELRETDADAFRTFLACLHGVCPPLDASSLDEMLELYRLLDAYMVDDLKSAVAEELRARTKGNVLELVRRSQAAGLRLDPFLGEGDCLAMCLKEVRCRFLKKESDRDFDLLSYELVKKILSVPAGPSAELPKFKALASWMKANPDEVDQDALNLIRFKFIPEFHSGKVLAGLVPIVQTVRNFDLCRFSKVEVFVYNDLMVMPESLRSLTGNATAGKAMCVVQTLPVSFYATKIEIKLRACDRLSSKGLQIKASFSEEKLEVERFDEAEWEDFPVVAGDLRSSLSFERRVVRQIRVFGQQDTRDKIFRLDSLECFCT